MDDRDGRGALLQQGLDNKPTKLTTGSSDCDTHDLPRARLVAACEAYLSFGAEHPHLYALMMGPNPRPDDTTGNDGRELRLNDSGEGIERLVGAESFRLLVQDVAAAAADGTSRADDPFLTATALWVALHGLVRLRADAPLGPQPDPGQLNDALIERIALLEPAPIAIPER
ncbi:TetR-like C-terminal domain-containing protein [Nocardia tengchongensis]|uniref:TetR-like C-terminal domain-containing protein n=1 Tax=Nocardia tengchongensis TaxID=2055889 RepID=UPI0036954F1F